MKTLHETIGRLITETANAHPKRDALIHTEAGVRYTYELLLWEAGRIARGLTALEIARGDRVVLWASNLPEWIVSQVALARIGAVLVPLDPGTEQEDLHYILEQCEARAAIVDPGLQADEAVPMMQAERERIPGLEHLIALSDKSFPGTLLWSELGAMGDDLPLRALEEREARVDPREPVAIMYTSGTTGRPKGVVLDHLALVNKSMASTERQGVDHTDRLCLFFPLFHMFGNTCIALAGLLRGAALVLPCGSFDPERILHALADEGCTAVYGSPGMIIALLEHPRFKAGKWRNVTKGTLGGAPCPMELMKRLVTEVGVSDITVAWGITETASWITMTHPDDPLELRVSTIGTPLPVNEVRIVDPVSGDPVPAGRPGELCVRGFLMKEYFRMPAATASAVDREGWFHSGDLGEMDGKGYVKITGRLKDIIERDGVRVHPTEVEEVLYGLFGVGEVQVFGFPHPERGQEMAAWIRPREGAELSVERLKAYGEEHLPPELWPRHYKLVDAFPTTRSGKVQKFKLAEQAREEYLGAP
ncbi:MAG: AMP-binding protein [Deltaproteobacteria bacterium]|nr:AMP-binding protein [Deltaproteobacteria bacterium]